MKSKSATSERQIALTQICDSDSYVAIIRKSLTPEQAAAHNPQHMANVLALVAENYMSHYDDIGLSFLTSNSLTINFKCDLANEIDKVKLSFLPTAKIESELSASVADDQPDLGDIKKESKGRAPKPGKKPLLIGDVAKEFQARLDRPNEIIVECNEVKEDAPELTEEICWVFVQKLQRMRDDVATYTEKDIYQEIEAFEENHGPAGIAMATDRANASAGISHFVFNALDAR